MDTWSLAQLVMSSASVTVNQNPGSAVQRLPLVQASNGAKLPQPGGDAVSFEAALSDARLSALLGANEASLLLPVRGSSAGVPAGPTGQHVPATVVPSEAIAIAPTTGSVGAPECMASPTGDTAMDNAAVMDSDAVMDGDAAMDNDTRSHSDNRVERQTIAETFTDSACIGVAVGLVQMTNGFALVADDLAAARADSVSEIPSAAVTPNTPQTATATTVSGGAAIALDTPLWPTLPPVGAPSIWLDSTDAAIGAALTGLRSTALPIGAAEQGLDGLVAVDGLASSTALESASTMDLPKNWLPTVWLGAEQQVMTANLTDTEGVPTVDAASPVIAPAIGQLEDREDCAPQTQWSLSAAQDAGVDGARMVPPDVRAADAQQVQVAAVSRRAEDPEGGAAQRDSSTSQVIDRPTDAQLSDGQPRSSLATPSVRAAVRSGDAVSQGTESVAETDADRPAEPVRPDATPSAQRLASRSTASIDHVEAQRRPLQGRDEVSVRPRYGGSARLQLDDTVLNTRVESTNRSVPHQRTANTLQRTGSPSVATIAEQQTVTAQPERATGVGGLVTRQAAVTQTTGVIQPTAVTRSAAVTQSVAVIQSVAATESVRQARTQGSILASTAETPPETAEYARESLDDMLRREADSSAQSSLAKETAQPNGDAAADRTRPVAATIESAVGRSPRENEPQLQSADPPSRSAETDSQYGRQVGSVRREASQRVEKAVLADLSVRRSRAGEHGTSTESPRPDRLASTVTSDGRRASLVTIAGAGEAQRARAQLGMQGVSSRRLLDAYEVTSAGAGTLRGEQPTPDDAASRRSHVGEPLESRPSPSFAPEQITWAPAQVEETADQRTPAGEPTEAARPRSLVDQVVSKVSYDAIGDRSRITIGLEPKRLGSIEIQVELDNGRVVASIAAETDEARRTLRSSADQLLNALREQGIDVSEVRVGSMQSAKSDPNGSDLRHEYEQGQQRGSGAANQQMSSQGNPEQRGQQWQEVFYRPRSLGTWGFYGVESHGGSSDSFAGSTVGLGMAVQLEYRA